MNSCASHMLMVDSCEQDKVEVQNFEEDTPVTSATSATRSFVVHTLAPDHLVVLYRSPVVGCIELLCQVMDHIQTAHNRKAREVEESYR